MRRRSVGRQGPDRREGLAPNGKPHESVWDFPRPPQVEQVEWRIRVVHAGITVADAPRAWRVLETSQPPAYYVAPEHVDVSLFASSELRTMCEWKGVASYVDVHVADEVVQGAAWTYRTPVERFAPLAGHWAFYAQRFDECWVDDEQVSSNDGQFYGGWITENVTGPFKGSPGTMHW
jgi:uncharacterized protein (DUF427 family)